MPNVWNTGAVACSVALHALVAFFVLSSVAPVEIMPPQRAVSITLVPVLEVEKSQRKPDVPVSQEQPQRKKTEELASGAREASRRPGNEPSVSREKASRARTPSKIVPAAPSQKEEYLAALRPSAGGASVAPASAQPLTTAPLFDAAYLNNPAPEYPAQAKRRGMEGSVVLGVAVTVDGTAKSVTIAQSSGFAMLDASAREAVSRWKFIPARRGGNTVEARVLVPIEFRLK